MSLAKHGEQPSCLPTITVAVISNVHSRAPAIGPVLSPALTQARA
jgi:hypothetical protein